MSDLHELHTPLSEALRILSRWKIEHSNQLQLLDLPDDIKPRKLTQMRNGDRHPQENHSMLDRIKHIFAIDSTLQHMFPFNSGMADYWITTPNIQLQESSPLEYMLAHGYEGMQTVSDQLSGVDNW